jgi:hypothetical protein
VTIYEPTHVTSYCNLLAPDLQLSSNRRSARMSFSQVQACSLPNTTWRVVHTCQNEFTDTFHDPPMPNKSTMSHFRYSSSSSPVCIKHDERSECMHYWTRWTFPALNKIFSGFIVIYFFTYRTYVGNGLREFCYSAYWTIKTEILCGVASSEV